MAKHCVSIAVMLFVTCILIACTPKEHTKKQDAQETLAVKIPSYTTEEVVTDESSIEASLDALPFETITAEEGNGFLNAFIIVPNPENEWMMPLFLNALEKDIQNLNAKEIDVAKDDEGKEGTAPSVRIFVYPSFFYFEEGIPFYVHEDGKTYKQSQHHPQVVVEDGGDNDGTDAINPLNPTYQGNSCGDEMVVETKTDPAENKRCINLGDEQ